MRYSNLKHINLNTKFILNSPSSTRTKDVIRKLLELNK